MIRASVDTGDMNKLVSDMKDLQMKHTMMLIEIGASINIILRTRLNNVLGEKAKHFNINISPNVNDLLVEVKPVDDVGVFIASGTKPHVITSSTPMPVGGGRVAMSVQHPGTPEYGSAIEEAVLTSVRDAFALAALAQ